MTSSEIITGDIPTVFGNLDGLYEGNLWYYLRVINQAPNVLLPYHGSRHVLHTTWLIYRACVFYRAQLTKRRIRTTLVAGTLHDHGNAGTSKVPDDVNIRVAQAAAAELIAPEDRFELPVVQRIIGASLFTKDGHRPPESLEEAIMQDADVAQALSPAWYDLIVNGLGRESGVTPEEMLEGQIRFLRRLHFTTEWAQTTFPPTAIDAKITETRVIRDGLRSLT